MNQKEEIFVMEFDDCGGKTELTEEELDFLEGWMDDCGGDEEWSESWDGYDV